MKNLPSRSAKAAAADGHAPPAELGDVAARYFFFGWLFRNAGAADPWVSSAALAFNIRQRHHLPVYMLRWAVIFAVSMALGTQLEHLAQGDLACVAYVVGVFALCYLFVAVAIFLGLEIAAHRR